MPERQILQPVTLGPQLGWQIWSKPYIRYWEFSFKLNGETCRNTETFLTPPSVYLQQHSRFTKQQAILLYPFTIA